MLPLPRFALLGVLFTCALAQGESPLVVTASTITDPVMERNVAHIDESASKGLAWRWTPEGRRDVGQSFQVVTPFEARELAIQVSSAMAKAQPKAPFRLQIFRSEAGISLDAKVAEWTGELPSAEQKPKSGTWFLLKFDPVKLEAGRYIFLLQFLDGPADGQGVVFVIANAGSDSDGLISSSADPERYQPSPSFNFILSGGNAETKAKADAAEARELLVDQRGGARYRTIAEAVQEAGPGDTIRLAKGSGPYRESLYLKKSGEEGRRIIVDGSGETITGFDVLTGFQKEEGKWVCDLREILANLKGVQGFAFADGAWRNDAFPKALPTVLTYKGERLIQNAKDGQFTKYAKLSEDGGRLILEEGVSPEGWEIAVRAHVVRVLNVSHQVYKNLRASGSVNDGFNLHGAGRDLVFENIEGFHNLDEGFSGHDQICCRIEKGRFWGNDNGLYGSQEELVASDIDIHDNLGYGFGISGGRAKLSHSRIWGNGMCQVALQQGTAEYEDVEVYEQTQPERPWQTVQESRKQERPEVSRMGSEAVMETAFSLLPATAPAQP